MIPKDITDLHMLMTLKIEPKLIIWHLFSASSYEDWKKLRDAFPEYYQEYLDWLCKLHNVVKVELLIRKDKKGNGHETDSQA